MTWYHGTPDIRDLRTAGRFTPRTEARRVIGDRSGLAKIMERMAAPGLSAAAAHAMSKEADACWETLDAPVPVFLSASRATATSYANDARAFDYQNAEPAVVAVDVGAAPDVTINAGGATFRGLTWGQIEAGLRASDLDSSVVSDMLFERLNGTQRDRIKVSDLGLALWSAGARVVEVTNVIDTHNGVGRPDTVRMVFDVDLIVIPEFAPADADVVEASDAPGM